MRGGAPRMHLTSRSVNDARMSAHEPHVMRAAKSSGGVSGGYVDPSVVVVSKRVEVKTAGQKRRERQKSNRCARTARG